MSPWILSVAAGLGASWGLDAIKPLVSIRTRWKSVIFAVADLVLWWAMALLLPQLPKPQVVLASVLISLGIGKASHAITSTLQATKDRNRMSVLVTQQPRH